MYSSRVLPPLLHLWESGGQLRKVSPGTACVVVGGVGQTLALKVGICKMDWHKAEMQALTLNQKLSGFAQLKQGESDLSLALWLVVRRC